MTAISMKICIPAPFMILLLLPKFQVSLVCRSMIFHEGYMTTVNPIHSGGDSPPICCCSISLFLSMEMLCRFGTFSLYLFDTVWVNLDCSRCLGQEIYSIFVGKSIIFLYISYISLKKSRTLSKKIQQKSKKSEKNPKNPEKSKKSKKNPKNPPKIRKIQKIYKKSKKS